MEASGPFTELGPDGLEAWGKLMDRVLSPGRLRAVSEGDDAEFATSDIDWPATPSRVLSCLGRDRAHQFLDLPVHGRNKQEEYCEWRTIRREDGAVIRVELTTELAAYWRVLAIHQPSRLLELIAELAGEESVSPGQIYGLDDPWSAAEDERDLGFAENMLAVATAGPYNSGEKAICCLIQETNTFQALARLAASASRPYLIEDEQGRKLLPNSPELIPPVVAQLGRSSDPVIAERLSRLAFEGRTVSLARPVGIFISSVARTRLRCPDGSIPPAEWFSLARDAGGDVDGRALHQRLVIEVPPARDYVLGDLTDVASEERIEHGAQIADLVQLALRLEVGLKARRTRPKLLAPRSRKDPLDCRSLTAAADQALAGSP
ncbi:MAG: hypothetical protein QOI31_1708 [Solirubrobacterales bacterium]|jgi:hypothetical protein|nr:hypothetical protein [Solirubrobacterales bacterium]